MLDDVATTRCICVDQIAEVSAHHAVHFSLEKRQKEVDDRNQTFLIFRQFLSLVRSRLTFVYLAIYF